MSENKQEDLADKFVGFIFKNKVLFWMLKSSLDKNFKIPIYCKVKYI